MKKTPRAKKPKAFSRGGSSGFSIIEIVLAISLFAIIALGAISTAFYGENAQVASGEHKRAALLAAESIEIVRSIRDSAASLSALPNGTSYGIGTDGSGAHILIADSPDTVGDFKRTVSVESVDDTTKKVTVSVCWPSTNCTTTVPIVTYFTAWEGGSLSTPGGIKVAVSGEGHAYVITTNNTLQVYDVSTPATPVKVGETSLAGGGGTLPNALAYASGKVYVASSDTAAELQIVDVSTPASPTLLGTLDTTFNTGATDNSGDAVWADTDGHGFLVIRDGYGTSSQIQEFDAADPTGPGLNFNGDIFGASVAQTPGGLAEGDIGGVPTICTTAGGAAGDTGYVLHCYAYVYEHGMTPTVMTGTITENDTSLLPSRAVAIVNGEYITAPGGKIIVNGGTPFTISSNPIYDISAVMRGSRLYAYLAVVADTSSGLKEVDATDATPVIISATDSGGTLSGTIYDGSVTPKHIFGVNQAGDPLGLVTFTPAPPTPIGLTLSPFTNIAAIMRKGASIVHCDSSMTVDTGAGCPLAYTITNVTGAPIDYTATASAAWVTLSSASGTIAGGGTATLTVSVDAAAANTADLSEAAHAATLHFGFTNASSETADITRTVTLTVDPAVGIKVRAQ